MTIREISTTPFTDQEPGTSELRQKVLIGGGGNLRHETGEAITDWIAAVEVLAQIIGHTGRTAPDVMM